MRVSKKQQLLTALNNIATSISATVEYPNCGGCGVIASIVGTYLEKFTGIQVVIQDWKRDNTPDLTFIKRKLDVTRFKNINDWDDKAGVDFNHVMLKVKVGKHWMVFDSEGVRPFYKDAFCKGSLPLSEIQKLARARAGWNKAFDRRQMPMIRQIVARELHTLEKAVTG